MISDRYQTTISYAAIIAAAYIVSFFVERFL